MRHRRLISIRSAILAIAFLGLAACSAVSVLYDQVDRVLRWQADSYLDLTSEQDNWLADQLSERKQWHRATQLPQYAAFLREAIQRVDRPEPLRVEELQSAQTRIDGMLTELAVGMAPLGADLLAGLSDAQVDHLAQELVERNDELRQKVAEAPFAERRQDIHDRLHDAFEDYFGSLTTMQNARLDSAVSQLVDDQREQIRYRELWQQDLLKLMPLRKSNREQFARAFEAMASDRERWYTQGYRESKEHNRAIYNALITDLMNGASAKQRDHVREQLNDWVETIDELAKS